MKVWKVRILVVLNIVLNLLSCDGQMEDDLDENLIETTVKMITVETTTQEVIIITDIAQEDVDAAMNLDVGVYTTQVFNYANFGFLKENADQICYQQHLKCVMDMSVPTPVCAVNDPFEIPAGYVTYDSICEVYLDNCRRLRHFWRILDFGKCIHYSEYHATVVETIRRSDGERPWKFIFYVLGTEDQNYRFNQTINKVP